MNLVFSLLLLGLISNAATFEVVNKENVLLSDTVTVQLPVSVGELSVRVFDTHSTPYKGGVYGFTEIYGFGQDIEVISDVEMKAYGWCFSVDGLVPETMADATPIVNQNSHVRWFYAYAHYTNGEWVAQCAE
jgi:hypothetical protein